MRDITLRATVSGGAPSVKESNTGLIDPVYITILQEYTDLGLEDLS